MISFLALLLAFLAGGAAATWLWLLVAYIRPPHPAEPFTDDNVRTIRPGRIETY